MIQVINSDGSEHLNVTKYLLSTKIQVSLRYHNWYLTVWQVTVKYNPACNVAQHSRRKQHVHNHIL